MQKYCLIVSSFRIILLPICNYLFLFAPIYFGKLRKNQILDLLEMHKYKDEIKKYRRKPNRFFQGNVCCQIGFNT